MQDILLIALPYFALIACGYGAARKNLLGETGIGGLTAFIFYFALPALLFRATATQPLADLIVPAFVGAYASSALVLYATGMITARLIFRAPLGGAAILGLSGSYPNIGFLAVPVIVALLGDVAAAPLALLVMFDIIILIPLTIFFLEKDRQSKASIRHAMREFMRDVVKNPLIIATTLGVGVSLAEVSLPGPFDVFTATLASAAGPAALFAVGASLVGKPVSEGMGEVAQTTLIKLFAHPAITWVFVTYVFELPPLLAKIAVLAASFPVAAMAFILSQRYGVYVSRVSTSILVSTLISVFTVSAVMAFL